MRALPIRRSMVVTLVVACGSTLPVAQDSGAPDVVQSTDAPSEASAVEPPSCVIPLVACGPICVDISSDILNCGACGESCSTDAGLGDGSTPVPICVAGNCRSECTGSLAKCGNQCVDETIDTNNCGGCGIVCDGGTCNQGTCCPPGQSECSGVCVDLTSNSSHCGSCTNICEADTCAFSACHDAEYDVGPDVQFSTTTLYTPGYLVAQPITVSKAATLLGFGVIASTTGQHVIMSLYTDSGGAPSALVGYSAPLALTGGRQHVVAMATASLSPATYWVVIDFDTAGSVYSDTNPTSSQVAVLGGYTTPPTMFPTATVFTAPPENYYIIVQ